MQDGEKAHLQGNDAMEDTKHKIDGQAYTFGFAFKQQLMRAWQPVPTLCCAIIMFGSFGLIFIFIGFGLYFRSLSLYDEAYRYDDKCTIGTSCQIRIDISEELADNVFFYYEIRNFYQNHRRYFKSKSSLQLRGNELSNDDVKDDCDPVVKNKDLWKTETITNAALDPDAVAFPCGMMARSYFNDTFQVHKIDDSTLAQVSVVSISSDGIAWPEDKKYKFKNLPGSKKNTLQWHDVEDERFMVWMRAAATPNFRKLWGKITSLPIIKGKYSVTIENNWDVKKFDGEKFFVISRTNTFGGKNTFLSVCYLVVGGICLLAATLFMVRRCLRPNGILAARLK